MRKSLLVGLVLVLVAGLMLGSVSVSFSQEEPAGVKIYNSPAEYQEATGEEISEYSESPVLAELVKAGKLPPVKERLPKIRLLCNHWKK